MRGRLMVAAVMALAAALACGNPLPGGGQSASKSPAASDACRLLTNAEVGGFLGQSVTTTDEDEDMSQSTTCSFTSKGDAALTLVLTREGDVDAAKQDFGDLDEIAQTDWQHLQGLGDEAKAAVAQPESDIVVRRGSLVVWIQVVDATPPPTLERLRALVEKALRRT